jgi:hypothetical protein
MKEECDAHAENADLRVDARFKLEDAAIRVYYVVRALHNPVFLFEALPEGRPPNVRYAPHIAWTYFVEPDTFSIERAIPRLSPGVRSVGVPTIPWMRAAEPARPVEGEIRVPLPAEEKGSYDVRERDKPYALARRLALALEYFPGGDVTVAPVSGRPDLLGFREHRPGVDRSRIEAITPIRTLLAVARHGSYAPPTVDSA